MKGFIQRSTYYTYEIVLFSCNIYYSDKNASFRLVVSEILFEN